MKETRFLTHDCNARSDPKLLKVQMNMGGEGLGMYWCIVEMLWENDGYLPVDYDILAFNLRWATPEKLRSLVEDYGLFENDGSRFWSNSALERIQRSEDARQLKVTAGRKGRAAQLGDAQAVPEHCPDDAQAVPERCPGPFYLSTFLNKNKSFSFSFEKSAEHEMLVAYFTFRKNVQNPNREAEKFLAFNNTDGRSWDDMPEKARRKAFDAWVQQPAGRPRYSQPFLARWAAFCDALVAAGAPQRVRLAALADGVRYEADNGTFRLWCPDVLRDWVEQHLPAVGPSLMAVAQGEGCQKLAYRKCAESVKP